MLYTYTDWQQSNMVFLLAFVIMASFSEALITIETLGPWYWKPVPISGINTREQIWITFKLRAPRDAYFGLQTYHNSDDDMFSVNFGTYVNTKCGLKPVGLPILKEVSCIGIVSNLEFRPFWVSWEGGLIRAGMGTEVGVDQLMSLDTPYPIDVHYLAVNSINVFTEWQIDSTEVGKSLKFGSIASDAHFIPDPRMLTLNKVASTRLRCSRWCLAQVWCRSFSYKATQQECRMFDSGPQTQELTQETGWETWGQKS